MTRTLSRCIFLGVAVCACSRSAPARAVALRETPQNTYRAKVSLWWCMIGGMYFVLRYLGTVAAVMLTVNLVPGITAEGGWPTLFLVALVWSVIVMVIKPVLTVLTLPITIITLGLFSFVLNALLFYAMTLVVPGFAVAGFIPALLGALVLSLLTWLIHKVL